MMLAAEGLEASKQKASTLANYPQILQAAKLVSLQWPAQPTPFFDATVQCVTLLGN